MMLAILQTTMLEYFMIENLKSGFSKPRCQNVLFVNYITEEDVGRAEVDHEENVAQANWHHEGVTSLKMKG